MGVHTDSRGTKQEKLDKSSSDAQIIKKDLVGMGISESRITTVGYGDEYILNDCRGTKKCTEEQHQVNRRVEVKILSVE
ncbi:MAG: hypothetical protein M0D57_03800 [Sphingobacteriales bacterium JAD_PAG50586_3]|nr:MAG: hypothetical protein M0D57_03800 [Sphingobacteriales bacterium JAD_PAG50586_3]